MPDLSWVHTCRSFQEAALDRLQRECIRTADWLAPYTRALGMSALCSVCPMLLICLGKATPPADSFYMQEME